MSITAAVFIALLHLTLVSLVGSSDDVSLACHSQHWQLAKSRGETLQ